MMNGVAMQRAISASLRLVGAVPPFVCDEGGTLVFRVPANLGLTWGHHTHFKERNRQGATMKQV